MGEEEEEEDGRQRERKIKPKWEMWIEYTRAEYLRVNVRACTALFVLVRLCTAECARRFAGFSSPLPNTRTHLQRINIVINSEVEKKQAFVAEKRELFYFVSPHTAAAGRIVHKGRFPYTARVHWRKANASRAASARARKENRTARKAPGECAARKMEERKSGWPNDWKRISDECERGARGVGQSCNKVTSCKSKQTFRCNVFPFFQVFIAGALGLGKVADYNTIPFQFYNFAVARHLFMRKLFSSLALSPFFIIFLLCSHFSGCAPFCILFSNQMMLLFVFFFSLFPLPGADGGSRLFAHLILFTSAHPHLAFSARDSSRSLFI